jgi:cytochrome c553
MKIGQIRNLLLGTTIVFVIGCGDNAANSKQAAPEAAPTNSVEVISEPKIEILQNTDAKAIKVEDKNPKGNERNDSYYYDYQVNSEFNSSSQPANEDAAMRTKPRTSIEANMNVRSPYENVQISLLVKKLSMNFIVKCSACHDDYANGVIGPSLLDRDSDYIFNAINDFKTGKKSNVLMNDLIKMMSSEEIRTLADEIYAFNQKIKELRK